MIHYQFDSCPLIQAGGKTKLQNKTTPNHFLKFILQFSPQVLPVKANYFCSKCSSINQIKALASIFPNN